MGMREASRQVASLRNQMEEDEQLRSLMAGLRGAHTDSSDFASASVSMQLLEVATQRTRPPACRAPTASCGGRMFAGRRSEHTYACLSSGGTGVNLPVPLSPRPTPDHRIRQARCCARESLCCGAPVFVRPQQPESDPGEGSMFRRQARACSRVRAGHGIFAHLADPGCMQGTAQAGRHIAARGAAPPRARAWTAPSCRSCTRRPRSTASGAGGRWRSRRARCSCSGSAAASLRASPGTSPPGAWPRRRCSGRSRCATS